MTDIWPMIETERLALADLLESLEPDEWSAPSLCSEWSVAEVAAHLAWANSTSLGALVGAVARQGFRANRASALLAQEWARRGPEAIIAKFRDLEGGRHLTPGTRPRDVLADYLTHNLDIRVPLDRPRPAPPEATRMALSCYRGMGFPLDLAFGRSPRRTAQGLRLVATDVGWAEGEGPEVRAASDAFLRALTGRPARREEFTGDGADLLASRLG